MKFIMGLILMGIAVVLNEPCYGTFNRSKETKQTKPKEPSFKFLYDMGQISNIKLKVYENFRDNFQMEICYRMTGQLRGYSQLVDDILKEIKRRDPYSISTNNLNSRGDRIRGIITNLITRWEEIVVQIITKMAPSTNRTASFSDLNVSLSNIENNIEFPSEGTKTEFMSIMEVVYDTIRSTHEIEKLIISLKENAAQQSSTANSFSINTRQARY